FAQNAQDVGVGAAKGAASTVIHSVDLVKNGLDKVADFFVGGKRTKNLSEVIPEDTYTPKNTAEKVGFGAEQTAEFLAPSGLVKDAETAINAASLLPDIGKVGQAALRVFGKAAVEGSVNAGVRAAQTGGDVGETTKTALLFGLTKAATGTVG